MDRKRNTQSRPNDSTSDSKRKRLNESQIINNFVSFVNSSSNQSSSFNSSANKQHKVIQAALGNNASLVLTNEGYVYAMGSNVDFLLGQGIYYGQNRSSNVPLLIDPKHFDNKKVVQISCNYNHALALCEDGSVYGWGNNITGCLGSGNTRSVTFPTLIVMGRGCKIKYVEAGDKISFMIGEANAALGKLNDYVIVCGRGELDAYHPFFKREDFLTPNDRYGLYPVTFFSEKFNHETPKKIFFSNPNYVTTNEGNVYAFPNDSMDKSSQQISAFFQNKPIKKICNDSYYNVSEAMTQDGELFVWGNLYGWANNKNLKKQEFQVVQPILIDSKHFNYESVVDISCCWSHALVTTTSGKLFMFGNVQGANSLSRILIPRIVHGLNNEPIRSVYTKTYYSESRSFVITQSGALYSWGENNNGELGLGHFKNKSIPQRNNFKEFNSTMIYQSMKMYDNSGYDDVELKFVSDKYK